mgnify:CR=1 FL=1
MLEFVALFLSVLAILFSLFASIASMAACSEAVKTRKQLEKLEQRARELITLTGRIARGGGDTSQMSGGGIDPGILQ